MLDGAKDSLDMDGSALVIFFDHSEMISAENTLF